MTRQIFRITGPDRLDFLQGLVTNDVARLCDGAVYAALLSAQGKYLADFLLIPADDAVLLDVAAPLAAGLAQRLNMYRLRANVEIAPTSLHVSRGTGPMPAGAIADPRHATLGWRHYGTAPLPESMAAPDWDALRVAHCIPESLIELIPNETYILEAGFERLRGVDFRKGCYVGQEVTARMKHKTVLKKGLETVEIEGAAPIGTRIEAAGKPAGILYTQAVDADGRGRAIAQLRFERAKGDMRAGQAVVRRLQEAPGKSAPAPS